MPNVASEPAGPSPRLPRPPAPPSGGSGQLPADSAFGDLLTTASAAEPEQNAPPPSKPDANAHEQPAQTAAGDGLGDAPSADSTSNTPAIHREPDRGNGANEKSDKAKEPHPSDQDKSSGKGKKADKPAANGGKSETQTANASTVAIVVTAAPVSPLQAEAAASSKAGANKVAVGEAVKSKLTSLSAFQAANGQAAGTQENASAGVAPASLSLQAAAKEGKPAENQLGDGKTADGDASATERTQTRGAIHPLTPGNASDAHKTETSAGAKTTIQTSIPLPPTGSVSQAASAASPTPSAPVASPPPAVIVPLAGVPIAIAGKALAGKNHFEIRLDPPELGRIDVRLDVDKDGRITSHLIADRKDTLDLLQRDASGLQRALQNAGLKTADSGLQFSLRDQWSNGNAGQQSNSGYRPAQAALTEEITQVSEAAPRIYGRIFSRAGGIDIRI